MDLAPGEEALEEPGVCSRCTSTAHSNPSYKARKLCRVSKKCLAQEPAKSSWAAVAGENEVSPREQTLGFTAVSTKEPPLPNVINTRFSVCQHLPFCYCFSSSLTSPPRTSSQVFANCCITRVNEKDLSLHLVFADNQPRQNP